MMKKLLTMFFCGCFLLVGLPLASAQTYFTVGHATQPTPLVAIAPANTPVCTGNGVLLTGTFTGGTSPFIYAWSPGTDLSSTTTDTTTASPTSNQIYTFTVTDSRNCSSSDDVTVIVDPLPAATASNLGPVCVGNNIVLNAGGGVDYDWVGPNGFVQSNTQSPVINNATLAMAGVYTVTVTNNAGCSATATTTVNVNDCTGLEEIKEIETMNIYPNPSDGNFNLAILFKNKPNNVLVEFYNMHGSLVLSKNFQKPGTELNENIRLTDAAAGNYFMRVTVGKHALTKTFIIK
jgi:hypothetical protein